MHLASLRAPEGKQRSVAITFCGKVKRESDDEKEAWQISMYVFKKMRGKIPKLTLIVEINL